MRGPPEAADAPRLLIDVQALAHNWRTVQATNPRGRVGAVLKNDAYGLGVDQVTPTLWALGCRDFWVATIDEARALRPHLRAADARIYVLNGMGGLPARDWLAEHLIPVLAGPHEIPALMQSRCATRLPVAVQLDTGLTRLGFDETALAQLRADSALWKHADLRLWVTHLGRFHDPQTPQCRRQRERFLQWTAALPAADRSIATSSSVFSGPAWQFEHARVGSALWGIATNVRVQAPLRPVACLQAPVLRVAEVPAGTEVGYAGSYISDRRRRIATVALGYGDGLPFGLVNRGHLMLADKPAPIVGGVAMGMVALDVSAFDPEEVQVGQWVEVFGRRQPVEVLASAAQVAPNVLLTLAGRLAHRRRLEALP